MMIATGVLMIGACPALMARADETDDRDHVANVPDVSETVGCGECGHDGDVSDDADAGVPVDGRHDVAPCCVQSSQMLSSLAEVSARASLVLLTGSGGVWDENDTIRELANRRLAHVFENILYDSSGDVGVVLSELSKFQI